MADTNNNKDINEENINNNKKDTIQKENHLIELKENKNKQINSNNNKYNQTSNCCECSEETKITLKYIFFPFFCLINAFKCFGDGRFRIETYYQTSLFVDNVVFSILSIIDLVFVIFYKEDISTAILVLRIISDSLGILILWMAFGLWSEEGSYEDHMYPAFFGFTFFECIITVGLDIASIAIYFTSDFKLNIILILCQIIHFVTPIVFLFIIICCK